MSHWHRLLLAYSTFTVTWSRSGPGLECALTEEVLRRSWFPWTPQRKPRSPASQPPTLSRGNTSMRPLFENGYCICRSFLSLEQQLNSDIFLCCTAQLTNCIMDCCVKYSNTCRTVYHGVLGKEKFKDEDGRSFVSSLCLLNCSCWRQADSSCLCFTNKPWYNPLLKASYWKQMW